MDFSHLLNFGYGSAWLFEFGTVFLLQLLLYLGATTSVGVFYKACALLGIGSRLDPRPTYPFQIGHELCWSAVTCGIAAAYLYVAFASVTTVYPENGVVAITQVLGFIVVYDFYMYATHRALHTNRLRKFHARHHTAVSPTPWSSLNMHPIEALINYFPFLCFAYVTPVSLIVLLGVHAYLIFGIANGHSNYKLIDLDRSSFVLRELVTFHQKHHGDSRANYGYLFTHWDWVFGTRHK